MDALIKLRLAVANAKTAQTRTQSELAQAVADLQKWEERERLTLSRVDLKELIKVTAVRKSMCEERVNSLRAIVEGNVETVSRLERQLALWESPKQTTIPSVNVAPKPSSSQQLQDRQDALNEKINKLTALLFDVQQEFQTLKKDIENNSLTEENQEVFSDIELEKLRILLDEL